jgi:hypothetical protein
MLERRQQDYSCNKWDCVLLHKIHRIIVPLRQTYPVGNAGNTHFRQDDFHHGVDHGGDVSNLQSLPDDHVWHEFVGIVDELQEILAFRR